MLIPRCPAPTSIGLQFTKEWFQLRPGFLKFNGKLIQHSFSLPFFKFKIWIVEIGEPPFEHHFLFPPASCYFQIIGCQWRLVSNWIFTLPGLGRFLLKLFMLNRSTVLLRIESMVGIYFTSCLFNCFNLVFVMSTIWKKALFTLEIVVMCFVFSIRLQNWA